MSEVYGDSQRALQDKFEARKLADKVEELIIHDEVQDDEKAFIESRDFFFLSTINNSGHPTVSYKGGAPGFVHVADQKTLVFPSYDGNGMYLSMGNIAAKSKIGMLFIDFETPHRVRVQATAEVSDDPALLARFPGAELVVKATVDQMWMNCPRYIHKYQRLDQSRYVPDANGQAPMPAWKRIDLVQEDLRPKDQGKADDQGGTITFDEYVEKLQDGSA